VSPLPVVVPPPSAVLPPWLVLVELVPAPAAPLPPAPVLSSWVPVAHPKVTPATRTIERRETGRIRAS
jgi:hypothetical protein